MTISNRCLSVLWAIVLSGGVVSAETMQSARILVSRPVIWRGCGKTIPAVTYGTLASRIAPVLWFSPDEPLLPVPQDRESVDVPLRSLKDADIPAVIPAFDTLSTTGSAAAPAKTTPPTVYYRIRLLRVSESAKHENYHLKPGVADQPVALDEVTSIYVRFFFYYPFDIGFGHHQHDLESVEMTLDVVKVVVTGVVKEECREVRLYRVSGAAHGVGWYTNTLNIYDATNDPVLVPPVVLVEEGKHATVPDRNGDGVYNPGYDVNVNPNDAWGIRDGLRNNRQAGSTYHAESAKPRNKMHRLFPPDFRGFGESYDTQAGRSGSDVAQYRYDLAEGGVAGNCDGNGNLQPVDKTGRTPLPESKWDDIDRLHEFLEKTHFCGVTDVKNPRTHTGTGGSGLTGLSAPYGAGVVPWNERFSWGYSYIAGQGSDSLHGVAFAGGQGLGLGSLTGGWLVPRISAHHGSSQWSYGVDALYTPSVSRIVDWYLAVGGDIARDTNAPADGYKWKTVEEFGFKLRVGVEPLIKRGLGFVNFRLGYRGPFQDGLSQGRWVIEFGFGGGF